MHNLSKKSLEMALFSLVMQADTYSKEIVKTCEMIMSTDYSEIQKIYLRKDLSKMQNTFKDLIEAKSEIKSLI
jgi:endonuclease III-like uncharacterized protein